jgi:hypothetical protein
MLVVIPSVWFHSLMGYLNYQTPLILIYSLTSTLFNYTVLTLLDLFVVIYTLSISMILLSLHIYLWFDLDNTINCYIISDCYSY